MADFTPINTQEEFDAAIADRIKREREKYSDYNDLKQAAADHQKTVNDLNAQIATLKTQNSAYETASVKTRIAHEMGLPYEFASRLKGDTEEDIRKDAETMKGFVGSGSYVPPLRSDGKGGDESDVRASLRGMLSAIKE